MHVEKNIWEFLFSYQKKPEDSIFENGDEWGLFVSLKIRC